MFMFETIQTKTDGSPNGNPFSLKGHVAVESASVKLDSPPGYILIVFLFDLPVATSTLVVYV